MSQPPRLLLSWLRRILAEIQDQMNTASKKLSDIECNKRDKKP